VSRLPRYGVCLLAGTVLWGALPTPSRAADPAAGTAVARGEDVARNVCSACHLATRDQPPASVPPQGPSFTDIANRPDTTLKSLRKFIATTHWDMKTLPATMPNPMLTDSQVSDVSHYILSLRTAGAGSK
jgi:mono/diheme cytochrome c family protein